MKISVVTNAFNQGRFLRRCMSSVLSHSDIDLEYIVVDPGSTDKTSEILSEYENSGEPRLKILREPDNGPADGLNNGFAAATGEWFIYLNADDFFLPGALNKGLQAIATNPGADCIYGDGYLTDIDGTPTRRVISTPFSAEGFVFRRCLVLQQSTFYKAESFHKLGGFNVENRTSWDAEILLDMCLADMYLVHVRGFWSAFVIHGESITGSQRHAVESKKNHERMFKKVMGRERTVADLKRIQRIRLQDRLLNPGATLVRLLDALNLGGLPNISAGLPPIESDEKATSV
ncbi:MAG: glycosyltransferase [Vannielia sp.]|uniref:glycosyltransferase family 2 protein n=1 Tax=Vannielia sp. TaxID=2813045 RepID=UPI003B8DBCA6